MVHLEVVRETQGPLPGETQPVAGHGPATIPPAPYLTDGELPRQGKALAQGLTASLAGHGKVWGRFWSQADLGENADSSSGVVWP